MNFGKILLTISASVLCVSSFGQNAANIAAAKSLARQYGYTDEEINKVLNHDIDNNGIAEVQVATPIETLAADKHEKEDSLGFPKKKETKLKAEKPKEKINDEIYGHEFFKLERLGTVPSYNAPAPESYVLGPGDEVCIDIWGSTVSHVIGKISNQGSIVLNDLGPVYLAGMTLKKAEASLKAQLSQIYSGLSDDRGDTYLTLSISKIKGVVVNITGEVSVAGAYTIPALTTITSALYLAGGITDNGTVRNIRIFRGGKKAATFDLYDFIFKGASLDNFRLQDGDIINVPAYSLVTTIEGSVQRPQRYEMKEGESIQDLIDYSLGFTTNSRRDQVNITRFTVNGGESYDVTSSEFPSFKLKDGDVVNVHSFKNLHANRVVISGPVKYPGTYALDDKLHDVKSLVEAAGGLIEDAFPLRGQIKRLDDSLLPGYLSFNLKNAMEGIESVELHREDSVTVYSLKDMDEEFTINIDGHVINPGDYPFHEGMTVADAIMLANGVRKDAFKNTGMIRRIMKDGTLKSLHFNIDEALEGCGNMLLARLDSIRIFSNRELIEDAEIEVNGEVNKPGSYDFYEGMTLQDALLVANGSKNGADFTNIEVASRGGRERGKVVTYNLEENPDAWNIEIKPYDVISVRRLTYFRPQTTITVEGEVMAPGTYVIDKVQVRLSDILGKIHGFTDEAYLHGASLTRTLSVEEKEKIKQAVKLAQQRAMEEKKKDKKADQDDLDMLDVSMEKIDSTINANASFVIGIDLQKALNHPCSDEDVVLRAGDKIYIPQLNNTVKISGAVYYPNTVAFMRDMTWKQYIKQAGGFKKLARKSKTYALYMNGKMAVGNQIRPEPGMELIVPEKNPEENRKMSAAEIISLSSSTASLATMIMSLVRYL